MNIEERISGIEMIAYLAALLGLFVLLQWHDEYTAERIAAREQADRQQIADSIRDMDCGEIPVYLAQSPRGF